jgi:class 3 adenylate cyclase/tetratricopeptide (TPR) repeat protein
MPVCPRCGATNPPEALFCSSCGKDLQEPEAGREERKLVSALFVDLVGSTSRAEMQDPEEFREALGKYHSTARRQIERFGGSVEKFIGDAVVAIFGAPVAHGDDSERAVLAGLAVLEAIQELNRTQPDLDIQVRAAVNTGEAIVSIDARPELGEAFVVGDAINTAARLQSAAPAGRLIVGAETYRATRRSIDYEPTSPVDARGKAEPVEAWLTLAPRSEPSAMPRAATPFVGRHRELEHLMSIWARVVDDRRPEVVTLLGHPGIGKSRTSAELIARVQAGSGGSLSGRCLPYAEKSGYHASADQIRELANVLETDPPRREREKLGDAVASLVPADEAPEIARYLSLLLGLGTDEPTDDRLPLFFAVRRLVECLAGEQPTILAFEDAHWADESQLDLLEYLAKHLRDVPVMILVLARPELLDLRPTWGSGLLSHTTIPLEPLAPEDSALIAGHALGTVGSQAVERLVEVAAGNPLFLEELAANLAESTGDPVSLPATIREAIASRIDLLPREQRAVLLDASVIGKTFWRGVLSSVGAVEEIDEPLSALEARDLIRRVPTSSVEGDIEFSFKHILIRDVAYATLSKTSRRERHAAVANFLEENAPENARAMAWLIGHHLKEAGQTARAVDRFLIAAETAKERWAKEEVTELYADALELVGTSDAGRRDQILLLQGIASMDLGDLEEGARLLDRIIPALEGRAQVEAMLARLRSTYFLEETELTFSLSERALQRATQLDEPELIAPAIGYLGAAHIMTGDLVKAKDGCERALSAWVPNTRPGDLAAVQELHAEVFYWIGDYRFAEELSRSAYQIGGEIHRIEPLLRGGGWQALTLSAMGRTEDSMTMLDHIIERSRELGEPAWAAAPLNYSSQSFRDLYMVDEARRRNEESLEMVAAHGEWGMPKLQGSIDLLIADLMDGEVGRAQARWPELWDAAINGKTWRPWLGGIRLAWVRAQMALQANDTETAIEWAGETLERATSSGRIKYELLARTVLAEVFPRVGRSTEAVREGKRSVEIADRLGTPALRWQTRATLARALESVGDDDGSGQVLSQARDLIQTWVQELQADHAESLLVAEPVREVLKATS